MRVFVFMLGKLLFVPVVRGQGVVVDYGSDGDCADQLAHANSRRFSVQKQIA